MPSSIASGAKEQLTRTVMLFKELKVLGVISNCDTPKFAPKNKRDKIAVTMDALPKWDLFIRLT